MKVVTYNLDRSIWRDLMKKSGMIALMNVPASAERNRNLERDPIGARAPNNARRWISLLF